MQHETGEVLQLLDVRCFMLFVVVVHTAKEEGSRSRFAVYKYIPIVRSATRSAAKLRMYRYDTADCL